MQDGCRFVHTIFREWFAARHVIKAVQATSDPAFALRRHFFNTQLLTHQVFVFVSCFHAAECLIVPPYCFSQTTILFLLAEEIQSHPQLAKSFLRVVQASAENEELAYASANAITSLNYAHFSFSDFELRGVRIRGADLSGVSRVIRHAIFFFVPLLLLELFQVLDRDRQADRDRERLCVRQGERERGREREKAGKRGESKCGCHGGKDEAAAGSAPFVMMQYCLRAICPTSAVFS